MRLIGGGFLFLDDHLERLGQSLEGSQMHPPNHKDVINSLRLLLAHNPITDGNVRICVRRSEQAVPDLLCYFISHNYPDAAMYREGVDMKCFRYQRQQPGVKKWDASFRTQVNAFVQEQGIYDALLLSEQGEVLEGSRSNIFFLDQQNTLRTPPLEQVLPGITRKHVLSLVHGMKVKVVEAPIPLSTLGQFEAAFLSGTSPGVLPVRKIEAWKFKADNPLLQGVVASYQRLMKSSLQTI
jgi:branched-chain amino acid aminotransferase